MSGGAVTFKWTKYKFIPPEINSEQFHDLKKVLESDPSYEVLPQKGFNAFANQFYLEFIGGCFLGVILFIFDSIFSKVKSSSFLEACLVGVFIWLFLGGFLSMYYYIIYLKRHNSYFKKVKILIVESKTYQEFLAALDS